MRVSKSTAVHISALALALFMCSGVVLYKMVEADCSISGMKHKPLLNRINDSRLVTSIESDYYVANNAINYGTSESKMDSEQRIQWLKFARNELERIHLKAPMYKNTNETLRILDNFLSGNK